MIIVYPAYYVVPIMMEDDFDLNPINESYRAVYQDNMEEDMTEENPFESIDEDFVKEFLSEKK